MDGFLERGKKYQNQTIQKLCLSRKLQNFQLLKEWDMKRAARLMIHRKLSDQFDQSLQQKLVESNAYMDVVRQFLTDLLNQKRKYEAQPVINPEPKIKQNWCGSIIYPNTSRILGRLHSLTPVKTYKHLKTLLEQSLKKMQDLLVQSQREIMQRRIKIEVAIVEIQDKNLQTAEMCDRLVNLYNRDKGKAPFTNQWDLYSQEQQFIEMAAIQTQSEKVLGVLTASYLDYLSNLESQKLTLTKSIISSYLTSYSLESPNSSEEEGIISSLKDILAKQTETEYIKLCYGIQEMTGREMLSEIWRIQGKYEKEGDKQIKMWMKKLQFEPFQGLSFLILKEYKTFLKDQDELQQVSLLITVDAFLLLCPPGRTTIIPNPPSHSFYIPGLALERQGDLGVKLSSKKNKEQISIACLSEDMREEILQFIQRITS